MNEFSGPPFDYMTENWYETQVSPSSIHCHNTLLHAYFAKYLEERAMSVFKWTIPDYWKPGIDFIRYVLLRMGFFTVTELGCWVTVMGFAILMVTVLEVTF